MSQSNPDFELPEMPLPPGLPADDAKTYGDPTTYGLPTHVEYQALIAMLEALLPSFDPTRVQRVTIDPRQVEVVVWARTHPETLQLPIRHVQGSATEGGQGT